MKQKKRLKRLKKANGAPTQMSWAYGHVASGQSHYQTDREVFHTVGYEVISFITIYHRYSLSLDIITMQHRLKTSHCGICCLSGSDEPEPTVNLLSIC